MKAEDLMIGDWVRGTSGVIGRVKGISENDVLVKTIYGDTWADNEILPIPLTPEILEKNGLHLYNRKTNSLLEECNHSDCFKEDEDLCVELSLNRDGSIRWTINGDEYTIMPLNYVHELQHALRLCNINKEIVL